jgi:hypothetical protein
MPKSLGLGLGEARRHYVRSGNLRSKRPTPIADADVQAGGNIELHQHNGKLRARANMGALLSIPMLAVPSLGTVSLSSLVPKHAAHSNQS